MGEAMDMARGRLRLRLLLMLRLVIEAMDTAATADLMEVMADPMEDMEAMAGPMEDMGAMDMARGRPRLLLMLRLVIEAMDTAAMADLMEAMVDMAGPMEDMVDMSMASEYLLTQTCFSNPTLLFMLQLIHLSLQNS